MIEEAERYRTRASRARRFGRFQFEAAIQSAHAQRVRTGNTDWEAIALLYEGLVAFLPRSAQGSVTRPRLPKLEGRRTAGRFFRPYHLPR